LFFLFSGFRLIKKTGEKQPDALTGNLAAVIHQTDLAGLFYQLIKKT